MQWERLRVCTSRLRVVRVIRVIGFICKLCLLALYLHLGSLGLQCTESHAVSRGSRHSYCNFVDWSGWTLINLKIFPCNFFSLFVIIQQFCNFNLNLYCVHSSQSFIFVGSAHHYPCCVLVSADSAQIILLWISSRGIHLVLLLNLVIVFHPYRILFFTAYF